MLNRKFDIVSTILIVALTVLAVLQVHGMVMKPSAASDAVPVQYTVERQAEPEARPEPPPRTSGRSGIKVARAHTMVETD